MANHAWEEKELDEHAANELYLCVKNDGDLYNRQYVPIIKNLVAKKARGVYRSAPAAKLFGYLVESGAKKYCAEFCSKGDKWHEIFPKKLRDAVAEELRDDFEAEYDLGNYGHLVPKKYQKKPATRKRKPRPSAGVRGLR